MIDNIFYATVAMLGVMAIPFTFLFALGTMAKMLKRRPPPSPQLLYDDD